MTKYFSVETSINTSVVYPDPDSDEHILRADFCADMPSGFDLRADGIWQTRTTKDDEEEIVWLCSPLRVVALCRRSDGSGWSHLIELIDADGRMHAVLIDAATISGSPSKLVEPLVRNGLILARQPKVKDSVAELLNAWRPERRLVLVGSLGWIDDACSGFALADGRVLGSGSVHYPGATAELAATIIPCGTAAEWRREVAEPCTGNALAMLAVSQAFTGPLLQLLGMEGGGFHLVGASSCGKSTLLKVAASVWGSSELVRSWRATDNALEPIAAASSGTLLLLDEIAQIDPRKLGDVAYLLGNGQGKARMGRFADLTPSLRWSVAVLSSGEISIAEHIHSAGRITHAGQHVRLVDLPADGRAFGAFDKLNGSKTGKVFAERLARSAAMNSGLAGPTFVEAVIRNRGQLAAMRAAIEIFSALASRKHDLPQDAQVQRVLKRFALAALAGELATRFDLTGWPAGAANNAMLSLVGNWFELQGKASRSEIEASLERTRNYVRAHAATNLAELDSPSANAKDGWRDDSWFYLLPHIWKHIHGHDFIEDARRHRSAGLLRCSDGHNQFRMPRKVPGQPRVYAVSAQILLGDEGAPD